MHITTILLLMSGSILLVLAGGLGWWLRTVRLEGDAKEAEMRGRPGLCVDCGKTETGLLIGLSLMDGTDPRGFFLCDACTRKVCRWWWTTIRPMEPGTLAMLTDHVAALARRRKREADDADAAVAGAVGEGVPVVRRAGAVSGS